MSARVIAMLAQRWSCSVTEVRDRIAAKVQAAGLVAKDAVVQDYKGEPYQRKLTLGVTVDDRVALLDANDHVVMWLDDEKAH